MTQTTYTVAQPTDFLPIVKEILGYPYVTTGQAVVIALMGDLGAGKATFTQQLGAVLGVSGSITSPTFTIMKQYPLTHAQFDTLVHIDAYRFESESEAVPLRLTEIFETPRTIVCLEWPERIATVVSDTAIKMNIEVGPNNDRIVTIDWPTGK